MSNYSDETGMAFVAAIGLIIAYFLSKEPEDYVIDRRTAEDCWYPPTCDIMTSLVPRLAANDIVYNKAAAIADADATVSSLFARFKQDVLPTIYQPMCQANGYNATTTQLLANDAYNKTVQDGAKTILDNIKAYSNIRQGDLQVMAQIIGSIKNSISQSVVGGYSNQIGFGDVFSAAMGIGGKIVGAGD